MQSNVELWFADGCGMFFAKAWYEALDVDELHRFLQEEQRPQRPSQERLTAAVLAAFPPSEVRALQYGYPEATTSITVRDDSLWLADLTDESDASSDAQ